MEGQGEFPSVQQYNLERGKVGKGGRGRDEGYGKWELADLPTLQ